MDFLNSNDVGQLPKTAEQAEQILSRLVEQSAGPSVNSVADVAPKSQLPIDLPSLAQERGGTTADELRTADARYRALVEQIPAITFMASLSGNGNKNENEIYVSPHIETMLGFTQQEWLGDPFLWYRQLHPDDRVRWHDEFAKTCAFGMHFKSQYRFLSRDGKTVWVHGEAHVIRDDDGVPLFLHGIAFDITESKRAEQVLREAQHLLEQRVEQRTAELRASQEQSRRNSRLLAAIVDNAVDAIITIDDGCIVRSVNDAAERIFGYTEAEMLGQNVKILMPDPYREEHDQYVQNYLLTGHRKIIGIGREVLGQRKDGSTFPMELAVSEVKTGDQLLFTGIVRDITARKRGEREVAAARTSAEQANRAKSEFLANMSHEIRTPMNGIIGMAELALDTELTAEQHEFIDTIRDSSYALLNIINDILDFSKIEAGKMELESIPLNLRDLVGSTFKSLGIRAHRKNLELAWRVASEVPETIVGDATRLRQVILNLVGNAVKFTDAGEVVLDVRVESRNEDTVLLRFSVRDTGVGIAPDKKQSIFSEFTQADASTTRTHGGTGLGLSISAKLVQLMGGRIGVESEPGQGSTFYFVVPLPCEKDAATSVKPLHEIDVLLIDDNATHLSILREVLQQWGMAPVAVESAEAGLAAVRQSLADERPFPLVITDGQMPNMDGFTFVERLRELDSSTAVVMMLTSVEARSKQRCKALGVDSQLFKPIRQSELLKAIQEALGTLVEDPKTERRSETLKDRQLRILLMEDNPVNQKVAMRLLTKWRHSVELASNGREGISLWRKKEFDVILTDIQMPIMDGLTATMKIRELEQSTEQHIPIIAMTAHAMPEDCARCLRAGMDGYVSKPIDANELREMLQNLGCTNAPPSHDDHQHQPEFDRNVALRFCDGDEHLLQEIASQFVQDAPHMMRNTHHAIQRTSAS